MCSPVVGPWEPVIVFTRLGGPPATVSSVREEVLVMVEWGGKLPEPLRNAG